MSEQMSEQMNEQMNEQINEYSIVRSIESINYKLVNRIKQLYEQPKYYIQTVKYIKINGWIKSFRVQGKMSFLTMNDGSLFKCIQIVFSSQIISKIKQEKLTTGACIGINGHIVNSISDGQSFEIHVQSDDDIIIHGQIIGQNPIAKTKLGLDFLRSIPHLRPKTNTFSAITRIRHYLAMGTHEFYGKIKGFYLIAPPQITSNDCEGGGEAFQVTTLLSDPNKLLNQMKNEK